MPTTEASEQRPALPDVDTAAKCPGCGMTYCIGPSCPLRQP